MSISIENNNQSINQSIYNIVKSFFSSPKSWLSEKFQVSHNLGKEERYYTYILYRFSSGFLEEVSKTQADTLFKSQFLARAYLSHVLFKREMQNSLENGNRAHSYLDMDSLFYELSWYKHKRIAE